METTVQAINQEWFDIVSGLIEARLILKQQINALELELQRTQTDNEHLRARLVALNQEQQEAIAAEAREIIARK